MFFLRNVNFIKKLIKLAFQLFAMKKIVLILVTVLFTNCSPTDSVTPILNTCPTTDLGITANYQYLSQNFNPVFGWTNSVWGWKKTGTELVIAQAPNPNSGFFSGVDDVFYFKMENNCVSFVKLVSQPYSECYTISIDANGNTTGGPPPPSIYTANNFELQEWSENERIVGKYTINTTYPNGTVSTTELKLWVNFDLSNQLN